MFTLIGLPQCSTCKAIEKTLKAKGHAYQYRHIVEETPTADELAQWFSRSGETNFKKIVNTSGQKYRELNLKERLADTSSDAQFALIAEDGMLIKRPILLTQAGEVYWGANVQKFVDNL
ncbi:MAG: Spx/MgsR family RNA polymerase-binding regulatory protein [Aerococcaceae bacterium]|nr:Spx/MgsR family RNA polymerase-binding regulatory protein [Aerococcaceae bacterium]